jgi:hypothetical protein
MNLESGFKGFTKLNTRNSIINNRETNKKFLIDNNINISNIIFVTGPTFIYDTKTKEINPDNFLSFPMASDGKFFTEVDHIQHTNIDNRKMLSVKTLALKNLKELTTLLNSSKDKIVIYDNFKDFELSMDRIRVHFIDDNHWTNQPIKLEGPVTEYKIDNNGFHILKSTYEDGRVEEKILN